MEPTPSDSADEFRLDQTKFSVAYWLTRPVGERLQALENLRRTFYGHAATSEGIQRVLEVVKLKRS